MQSRKQLHAKQRFRVFSSERSLFLILKPLSISTGRKDLNAYRWRTRLKRVQQQGAFNDVYSFRC